MLIDQRTGAWPNSAEFTNFEVPKRECKADSHQSGTSRISKTSQASFGLGISDLSSDFMCAFDTWDVGTK